MENINSEEHILQDDTHLLRVKTLKSISWNSHISPLTGMVGDVKTFSIPYTSIARQVSPDVVVLEIKADLILHETVTYICKKMFSRGRCNF